MSACWPKYRAQPSGVESKRSSWMFGSAPSPQQRAGQLEVPVFRGLVQRCLPRLVAAHVSAPLGVHVEAKLGQDLDRHGVADCGRPRDQGRPRGAQLARQAGIVREQLLEPRLVGGQHRGGERVRGRQVGRRRTVRDRVVHEVRVPGRGRHVDVALDNARVTLQQAPGLLPLPRLVVVVAQAGEPQERVGVGIGTRYARCPRRKAERRR